MNDAELREIRERVRAVDTNFPWRTRLSQDVERLLDEVERQRQVLLSVHRAFTNPMRWYSPEAAHKGCFNYYADQPCGTCTGCAVRKILDGTLGEGLDATITKRAVETPKMALTRRRLEAAQRRDAGAMQLGDVELLDAYAREQFGPMWRPEHDRLPGVRQRVIVAASKGTPKWSLEADATYLLDRVEQLEAALTWNRWHVDAPRTCT